MTRIIPLSRGLAAGKTDTAFPLSPADDNSLRQRQRTWLDALPENMASIVTAWNKLKHVNWDARIISQLLTSAGTLADASRNLLLPRIAERASELQQWLSRIAAHSNTASSERQEVDNALAALQEAVTNARRYNSRVQVPVTTETPAALPISVALVEEDLQQASHMRQVLEQAGYQVCICHHPRELDGLIAEQFFNIIVMDTGYGDDSLGGVQWLEQHRQRVQDSCVVFLSPRTDIVARLRALRAGANGYLVKCGETAQALELQLRELLARQHPQREKVLIVDNHAERAETLAHDLRGTGFEVELLKLPLMLLERMARLQPDILLINHNLPGCSGLELGRMLRHDPQLMGIPVVFLDDGEADDTQRQTLALIGNASLQLPMDSEATATLLRTEISRARLRGITPHQPNKAVAPRTLHSRSQFLHGLEQLLNEAGIDGESKARHWYLVQMKADGASLLRKHLRLREQVDLEDAIERFLAARVEIDANGCPLGELSYAFVMHDLEGRGGEPLLGDLQYALRQQHWHHPESAMPITFSLGAVALSGLRSLDEAMEKTAQACLRASTNGGNQIMWNSVVPIQKHQITPPMRHALRSRSFRLVYQPIINLDQEDAWFETLVRLVDANGQVYMPNEFLDAIEHDLDGGHFAFDRHIIEQSLQAMASLGGKNAAGYSLVVKLTPNLLQLERLLPYISNVVNGARLRGVKRTTFAMPEHAVLSDLMRARRLISQLHGLNCGFMLEQLTPQRHTLLHLQELGPVDFIKLDPQWTRNSSDAQIRDGIRQLQRISPEARLVATHVEDARSFAMLWDVGVRYFQGYFIQAPGEELNAAPFEASA